MKRIGVITSLLLFLSLSSWAQSGWPWWIPVPVPAGGYIKTETAYGTNATTTVFRLYGPSITNMILNGRTTSVYFAIGGDTNAETQATNAWAYILENSNGIYYALSRTNTYDQAVLNAANWTNWASIWTNGLWTNAVAIEGTTNAVTFSNNTLYVWYRTNSLAEVDPIFAAWTNAPVLKQPLNMTTNAITNLTSLLSYREMWNIPGEYYRWGVLTDGGVPVESSKSALFGFYGDTLGKWSGYQFTGPGPNAANNLPAWLYWDGAEYKRKQLAFYTDIPSIANLVTTNGIGATGTGYWAQTNNGGTNVWTEITPGGGGGGGDVYLASNNLFSAGTSNRMDTIAITNRTIMQDGALTDTQRVMRGVALVPTPGAHSVSQATLDAATNTTLVASKTYTDGGYVRTNEVRDVAVSNVLVRGVVTGGKYTNATYFGNGGGLTNIPEIVRPTTFMGALGCTLGSGTWNVDLSDTDAQWWALFCVGQPGSYVAAVDFHVGSSLTNKVMSGLIYVMSATNTGSFATWNVFSALNWDINLPSNNPGGVVLDTYGTAIPCASNTVVKFLYMKDDNAGGSGGQILMNNMVLIRQ